MKHQNIIPIIAGDGNTPYLIYYYTAMTIELNFIDAVFNTSSDYVVYFDWNEETRESKKRKTTLLNVDPKTISRVRFSKVFEIRTDKYVVLMPNEIWLELLARLQNVPAKRKQTIARIFIYLFYNCNGYGFYTHSRDQIVSELHIQKQHLSEALKWLDDNGFIVRAKSFWSEQESRATAFAIPDMKFDQK